MNSALIALDAVGHVLRWNESAERLFGVSLDDALGQTMESLPLSCAWGALGEGLRESQRTRNEVRLADQPFQRPDEREGLLGITVTPMLDAFGRHNGHLVHAADITDRRESEVASSEAGTLGAIGQLSAGLAREIGTPVTDVAQHTRRATLASRRVLALLERGRGLAESAEDDAALGAALRELLSGDELNKAEQELAGALERAHGDLASVVELLRAMKGFTGDTREAHDHIDLNELAWNTAAVARSVWRGAARLDLVLADELPSTRGDAHELGQALLAVLLQSVGAIEANEGEPGQIVVRTQARDGFLELSVEDDGGGLSVERRIDRLGAHAGSPAESDAAHGAAIVHQAVVQHHGGQIHIGDDGAGRTTVVLAIPVRS